MLQLEAALEEWRTGTFVPQALSPAHEKRYRFHLGNLENLRVNMPRHCRNLMNFISEECL